MDIKPEHYELTIALSALEGAMGGLWYPSESDALVSLVIYADPMPNPEAVAKKLATDGDNCEVHPAEAFFGPVLNNPYWARAATWPKNMPTCAMCSKPT